MKKRFILALCLLLFVSLTSFNGTIVDAATATKKVSIKYAGGNYYGEVKNGKPHGKGTMRWGKNKTYSGDWVDGKRSGKGTYKNVVNVTAANEDEIAQQRTIYIGQWKNDKKNGEGYLIFNNGERLSSSIRSAARGTFKNDVLIKGYSTNQESHSYKSYTYKDGAISLEVTSGGFFTDGSFKEGKDIGQFSNVYYSTTDKKGNNKSTNYVININTAINEVLIGYSYEIEVTEMVNGKEKNSYTTDGEIQNLNTSSKILKIINSYASGFDSINTLLEGF